MSLPQIVLQNQYGEESINKILPGGTDIPVSSPVAAHTVIMNNTGGAALPTAVAVQAVADALPAKAGIALISAEDAADAVTIALSTGDVYTDAAVNTAVNTALSSVITDINAVITQVNAILAALKVVS